MKVGDHFEYKGFMITINFQCILFYFSCCSAVFYRLSYLVLAGDVTSKAQRQHYHDTVYW